MYLESERILINRMISNGERRRVYFFFLINIDFITFLKMICRKIMRGSCVSNAFLRYVKKFSFYIIDIARSEEIARFMRLSYYVRCIFQFKLRGKSDADTSGTRTM